MDLIKNIRKDIKSSDIFELVGNIVLAGLLFAVINYLFYYQPVAYVNMVSEDSWTEYATFLCWFFTMFVLLWLLVRYPEFRKPGYFLFAIAAFFMAMEEISWGQRIFGFEQPEFFRKSNIQGEMNLHNFVETRHYYRYIELILFTGAIVLPILATLFKKLKDLCSYIGIPIVHFRYWPFFILTISFFEYHSIVHKLSDYCIRFLREDELVEIGLGLAVFLMTSDWLLRLRRKVTALTSLIVSISLVAVLGICTSFMVGFFPDEGALKYFLTQAGTRKYPGNAMYQQADLVFKYIDRNPRYQKDDSRYYHGLVLLKLNKREDAKEVLNKAHKELHQRAQKEPDNPEIYRDIGRIFHALDKIPEAKEAYNKSIELDQKRLKRASDAKEEAYYNWSLGKTLFAMGQYETATERLNYAAEVSPLKSLKKDILYWMKKEKKSLSRLLPTDIVTIDSDMIPLTQK